ncbi:MAG: nicotinamide riboside transporter PnuC [Tannerellaceae bacterium]|jgi:nicotinamide mononucleotide transporter|nr:nicotinamide riboside transporter PnuC [Tannerellaceae bacterium]
MIEYFGAITGLLYTVLEVKQHRMMWIVGFVTSLAYVFVFFSAKIYADMGLQIYYVLISIYGFRLWTRPGKNDKPQGSVENDKAIVYRHIRKPLLAGVVSAIALACFMIYYFLANFTDSPIPLGDAFTTAVGIVATWMLARRILEHWYFWIIANSISIYIYFLRGLYPTMFLYLCYTLLSIAGFYTWIKRGTETDDTTL